MRYFLLQTILKSARVILWPAVFVNTFVMSTLLSSNLSSNFCLSLALCFASAFGFIINDLFDTNVDRVNRSGRLEDAPLDTIRAVQWAAIASAVLGTLFATVVSATALVSILVILVSLAAYTFVLRQRLFIANALAVVLASSPVWLPFAVFHAAPNGFQVAVLVVSLVILLGREIAADARDVRGDAVAGRSTFATVFGQVTALRIAVALELAGCVLLVGSSVMRTGPLLSSPLLLYALTVIISLALARTALKLWPIKSHLPSVQARIQFITVTRLAMLLLPGIIFLGS